MRKIICLSMICAGLLGQSHAQTPWVNRFADDWTAVADFDNDGNPDVLHVQAAYGTYQILYGDPEGDQLSPQRLLGTMEVTGMTVGKFKNLTHDRFLVTSPSLNQLNWFDDASRLGSTALRSQPVFGIGPSQVVALSKIVPSLGDEQDLFIASVANNDGTLLERMDGQDGSLISIPQLSDTLKEGNAVLLKNGGSQVAAFIRVNELGEESLWAGDADTLLFDTLIDHPLTGSGNRFAAAVMSPETHTRFVGWREGGKTVTIYNVQESVATPGTYELTESFSETFLGKTLQSVVILGTDPHHLLFTFQENLPAELHEFNGTDTLTLLTSFDPPVGGAVRAAAPMGGGNFALMTASDPNGPTDSLDVRSHTQAPYASKISYSLDTRQVGNTANVFIYDQEPFVGQGGVRRYAVQAPDWSVDASIAANELQAVRQIDSGTEAGLELESPLDLGAWTEGGFTLYNQWLDDLSLVSLDQNLGDRFVTATVSPEAGMYGESIQVVFEASPPGSSVFVRQAPDGTWVGYANPIPLARDTTYEFYAQTATGRRGPLQSVSYQFPSPDEMDSDGDGTPDYVELARGVDPSAGHDSDGDGWSDLDEWNLGTDPTDPDEFPAEGSSRLPQNRRVDLLVTPQAHAVGVVGVEVVYAPEMNLLLSAPGGGIVEIVETSDNDPAVITDAFGYFSDIPRNKDFPWLVVSTPENFPVRNNVVEVRTELIGGKEQEVWELEGQSGRQLLGLIPRPELPPFAGPAYSHQGGNDIIEANAWIAAAIAYYSALEPVEISEILDPFDTLAALLFERAIGEKLLARGAVDSADVSLFSFRDGDVGRYAPSLEEIKSLRFPQNPGGSAYDSESFLSDVLNAVETGGGKVDDLKQLVLDIYRISTAFAETSPADYPPPVSVIRAFLSTGLLPPAYVAALEVDPASVNSAYSAVQILLGNFTPRSYVAGLTIYPSDLYPSTSECSLFVDGDQNPVALLDSRGRPFPLPFSFQLTPDMEFMVWGYSDVSSDCPGLALEVTELVFSSVAVAGATDRNGNLLPDEIENMLPLSGGLHTADSDSDGYSDLQEILEGTDPTDGFSFPGTAPVDLSLPEIQLKVAETMQVEWGWPASYQDRFSFILEESSDLQLDFEGQAFVLQTEGDTMRMSLPQGSESDVRFYRLGISLK